MRTLFLICSILFMHLTFSASGSGSDPYPINKGQWLVLQLQMDALQIFTKTNGRASFTVAQDPNDRHHETILVGYQIDPSLPAVEKNKIKSAIQKKIEELVTRWGFQNWAKFKYSDLQ